MNEDELDETATHKDFLLVRQEGTRSVQRSITHYNFDTIISVGYRVKIRIATRFRIWATERLREYLIKGFTMDDARQKELGSGQYWRELSEGLAIRATDKHFLTVQVDVLALHRPPCHLGNTGHRAKQLSTLRRPQA